MTASSDRTDPVHCTPLSAARTRLRSRFTRLIVGAVALPAVLLGALQLATEHRSEREHLRAQLRVTTRLAATSTDQFINAHAAGVALLADTAAAHRETPDLARLRARYPAFLTALTADADGMIVELQPPVRGDHRGQSVADRDYFRVPAVTGQPYVSNAFIGRADDKDPLVGVSAPMHVDGRFVGIVEGSIRIDRFTTLRSAVLRERGQEMLIVDRDGKVIHASEGLPFRFLQPLADAAFLADAELDDGVGPTRLHKSVLRNGGDAWAAMTQLRSGWRVVLFAPTQPLVADLQRRAITLAALVLFAVLGALLVARWQLGRLARATGAVLDAMRALATDGRAARWQPDDIPRELRPVADAIGELVLRFNATSAQLREALTRQSALADSLRRTVESHERDIAERTARLQAANTELERLSQTDALTGALNVRGFHAWVENHTRDGALTVSAAVIMLDLDHFKAYNDAYGHPAGDRVLRRVAAAAQAALRDSADRLARTGGEEFAVVLPGADLGTARAVAERMREAVQALSIPHEVAATGRLTISLGIVAAEAGELLDSVLQHADDALYRAKRGGRDRVTG
ncbi:sensor domain-containing diguanylate cyclase [Cognatilysobacter bugurensis]|uniref:diguanylate cyclase n=1 Tax=Cognatilysobacter bugurensis TaxID=543356 RepID=A0A918SYW3_9GAMM|nr:sensor domain-containing diguanylate cyclase [Lysobacter bugurensis]GHA79267.1 hypothetical protein GCM10007067_15930 [Lysobacter bugurensis]